MEKRIYLDEIPCAQKEADIKKYLASNFSNVREIDIYFNMGYVDFECDVEGEQEALEAYLENLHKTDLDKFREECPSLTPYDGAVYKIKSSYNLKWGEDVTDKVICYLIRQFWDDELGKEITIYKVFSKAGKRLY